MPLLVVGVEEAAQAATAVLPASWRSMTIAFLDVDQAQSMPMNM